MAKPTEYERGFNDAINRAASRAEQTVHGHNCWQMTTHQICLHIAKIIKEIPKEDKQNGLSLGRNHRKT